MYQVAVWLAFASVGPIALGGAITARLIAGSLSSKPRRLVVLASVMAQIVAIPLVAGLLVFLGSGFRFDSAASAAVQVIPFSVLTAAGYASVWIPLGCEATYLMRARAPRPWLAALVGAGALLAGVALVVGLGTLMGAATN